MVNWSKKNVLTNKNHGITPSIWWRDGGICGCATLFKQTPLPKWILEEDISPIPICTYLKVPEGFYPSENTRGREREVERWFSNDGILGASHRFTSFLTPGEWVPFFRRLVDSMNGTIRLKCQMSVKIQLINSYSWWCCTILRWYYHKMVAFVPISVGDIPKYP